MLELIISFGKIVLG